MSKARDGNGWTQEERDEFLAWAEMVRTATMSSIKLCPEDDFSGYRFSEKTITPKMLAGLKWWQPCPKPPKQDSILDEAARIITGARNADYGDHEREAGRIAEMWTTLLGARLNAPIVADDVDYMMILLKVCRGAHRYKRDNLVDICGYSALMAERHDE